MANLVVTKSCNRACEFCFAEISGSADAPRMSFELYLESLDRLQSSGVHEARLLGGEPTLHPRFIDMVDSALARGMHVTVFTGGLVSRRLTDALVERLSERINFLVNVVQPFVGRQAEAQQKLFERIGSRCLPGVTIDHPAVDLDHLLDLIARYDMLPRIRLGLAHATLSGDNRYLHPKHYPTVGRRVSALWAKAAACGVSLEFDCGWVPCMFPADAPAGLQAQLPIIGQRCGAIPDILPDGAAIHCFPLAEHPAAVTRFDALTPAVRARLGAQLAPSRRATIFSHCESCGWRRAGQCLGGCMAIALRRQPAADPPEIDNAA